MTRRNVVQFDIDGVLADFVLGYTQLAASMFPNRGIIPFGTREQPSWRFTLTSPQEDHAIWERIKDDPAWWFNLVDLVSVEEFGRLAILTREHNVYFATSRPGILAQEQTISWLEDRGIRRPQVIVTGLKGELAKACGADFALEDKAGNAIAISYMSRGTRSFILDQPYNHFNHTVVGGSVTRVQTVVEFLEEVSRVQ